MSTTANVLRSRASRSGMVIGVVAAAALVWAIAAAGPLNPPAGPVSSGGKTTQEIYDAVTSVQGLVTGNGRGPSVPGASRGAGTFAIGSGGSGISGPLIGFKFSASRPSGGGPVLNGVTIVREIGAGSHNVWRGTTAATAYPTATITIPTGGGSQVVTMQDVRIIAMRQFLAQRADGTYGQIEEIDLLGVQVQFADPTGANWNWNFGT